MKNMKAALKEHHDDKKVRASSLSSSSARAQALCLSAALSIDRFQCILRAQMAAPD